MPIPGEVTQMMLLLVNPDPETVIVPPKELREAGVSEVMVGAAAETVANWVPVPGGGTGGETGTFAKRPERSVRRDANEAREDMKIVYHGEKGGNGGRW